MERGFIANLQEKRKDNLKVEYWKSDIEQGAESYRGMY